ncbi:MAG: type VI secretion system contractile sheath large subunit [Pseudomonadota bacterium]|nr:type VI secretion system contractile sheath large subunit [Pseudomonadota bacterium]
MSESIQKKLLRVRPPRVRITYDVHTNGAIEKRELPFVVGIFADLSGDRDPNPADPKALLQDYKDRRIVDIDRDNFNEVLKQSVPRVALKSVNNVLPGSDGSALKGALVFESMADFDPINIVHKVPVLATIYQQRKLLRDAQSRAEVKDIAAKALDDAVLAMEGTGAHWASTAKAAVATLTETVEAISNAKPAEATTAQIQTASDSLKHRAVPTLRKTADYLKAEDASQETLKAANGKTTGSDAARAALKAAVAPFEAAAAAAEAALAELVVLADPNTAKVSDTTAKKLDTSSKTTLPPLVDAIEKETLYATVESDISEQLAAAFPASADFAAGVSAALRDHVFPVVSADGGSGIGRGSALSIDFAVAAIDAALSRQLSLIMHSGTFKEMEATWRGLFHLVSRAETGTRMKLRIFNATLRELQDDMSKAVEFDQSKLFKLIYEAEYGSFGGLPYSMLLGGYEVGPGAADMTFINAMSSVASAAHAPFLAAAAPSMFGLPDFGDLAKPRDLAKIFEGADLTAWSEFRGTEDSRYVSLVLPHVMLRLPYGDNTLQAEGFRFEENVLSDAGVPDNRNFLWGNAAYFLAERITNAFSLYSWTAAIRGVEGGGLVEGLPIYTFSSGGDDGIKEILCPTEVAITDRREKEINDLGFIALCHSKGSGKAAFFGGQTTNRPKKYINADANANAALSSRLPYIMAASRFAHYIKVIVRDKMGGFLTRGNVETFLNIWISQYVLLDDNASQDVKSAFPLREASIVVVDVPGEPGAYKATVFLKPHFQLEELTTSIRLVADLPK